MTLCQIERFVERDRAFEQETKVRRESLAALKDQAKAERRELEGFTSKRT